MKNRFFKILIVSVVFLLGYIYYFQNDIAAEKMNTVAVDVNEIDTLLNSNRYLVLGKNTMVKQIKIADTINYKGFFQMAWFQDTVIITDKRDYENLDFFLKYTSVDFFEDFKTPVYQGIL